ncbi:DUF4192 domain-containing protein [Pseudarthrobacter sp. NS4]|uniref:DUF4192 domain-containing protein n=1 Tax=Pseudarthrobacter sp. NS4 TaxID=2973976 RepID=UPI0021639F20|nr:DUF4192 domain-containing protein [Pseudarthrobacter sp. NS4]
MTAPEKLIISGPADILGFIPHSLGYWPADSLVAMTLHGKRAGATLRLDLPGREVLAAPGKFLRAVQRYLQADKDADGTLLAFFTSNGGATATSTYDGLLAGLDSMLSRAGMPVRDAWYVGDDYWRDAWCTDVSCCPLPGRSVQEIRDSALNAEMVYRGSSVGPAPERQPAAVRPVPSLHRAAVLEAQAGWAGELDLRWGSRAQLRAVLDLWEAILSRPEGEPWLPEAERDGFLRASLMVPAWRDAVMVMAVAGKAAAEAGADRFGILDDGNQLEPVCPPTEWPDSDSRPGADRDGQLAGARPANNRAVDATGAGGDNSGRTSSGYAEVLMGLNPAVPDWARLDSLDRLLEQLAALGGPAAAAALTIRGWIAWCRGRGSYAASYLGEALETEPGYRLAELLLEVVGRGAICGWAARKEAAWQKFGPETAAAAGKEPGGRA